MLAHKLREYLDRADKVKEHFLREPLTDVGVGSGQVAPVQRE